MTAKEAVQRAEKAMEALRLSATTETDRSRINRVWQGLRSLDEEQAIAKCDRDVLAERVKRLEVALADVTALVPKAEAER